MSTFGMAHSGEAAGSGSSTVTSSAAPVIRSSRERRRPAPPRRPPARAPTLRRYADGFMRRERIGIDQLLGFRRQRAGEGDEIGLRQQRAAASDIACTASARVRRRRAGRGGCRSRACRTPWRAARAGRRCCPRPTISSVLPPSSSSRCARSPIMPRQMPLRLVVARLGQPARERQDQRHRVLGDRAGIDAARRSPAACRAAGAPPRELVDAGADRLDEPQLRRARDQRVVPQPRDRQHVGLGDGCFEAARSRTSKLPMPVPRRSKRSCIR